MDALTAHEWSYALILEAFVLLLALLAFFVWRNRILKRRLSTAGTPGDGDDDPIQAWLEKERALTQARLEQVGDNTPEARHLKAACEFRQRVLDGERQVRTGSEDESLYWQHVSDYYDNINKGFLAQVHELEDRLRLQQERINNLEGFKEQVFKLSEKLQASRQTILKLDEELQKLLPAESRSAELEALLQGLADEKTQLEEQMKLVENEYETLMKNAEVLQQQIAEKHPPASEHEEELASLKEENEFLCNQIATLLKQELVHKNQLTSQEESFDKQLHERDEELAATQNKLAEMEKKYLELLETK
ncbi:MAG TPA: hypothetical protein ENI97_10320 [Gammaproteobacteria bacterium]|nr:hypothetical protein [Gammaproteobacteria bacterium]